jgi:putative transposase
VNAKLPLSEREYRCERCGMVMDRDLNAARNLALLVDANANGVAGSGPETENRPWMGREIWRPLGRPRRSGKPARAAGLDETGTGDWKRPAA